MGCSFHSFLPSVHSAPSIEYFLPSIVRTPDVLPSSIPPCHSGPPPFHFFLLFLSIPYSFHSWACNNKVRWDRTTPAPWNSPTSTRDINVTTLGSAPVCRGGCASSRGAAPALTRDPGRLRGLPGARALATTLDRQPPPAGEGRHARPLSDPRRRLQRGRRPRRRTGREPRYLPRQQQASHLRVPASRPTSASAPTPSAAVARVRHCLSMGSTASTTNAASFLRPHAHHHRQRLRGGGRCSASAPSTSVNKGARTGAAKRRARPDQTPLPTVPHPSIPSPTIFRQRSPP